MNSLSVRSRVLLWYLLLVAMALAVSVFLTHQLLLTYLDQRADSELATEVAELHAIVHNGVDPQTNRPLRSVAGVLSVALARGLPEPDAGAVALLNGRVVGQVR